MKYYTPIIASRRRDSFPTAVITSTIFGRIGRATTIGSRKIQLGAKVLFLVQKNAAIL
jgi:hypothetical protein